LDAGKKEANLRITQRNSEAKTLAEEIREGEERKNRLSALSKEAEHEVSTVTNQELAAQDLESQQSLISETLALKTRLSKLRRIVSSLTVPDTVETEKLHRKSNLFAQAAVLIRKRTFLGEVESRIDDTVEVWDAVAKAYKRRKAFLELLAIRQRKGLAPKECSEQLGILLATAELALSSASTLSAIARVANMAQPARTKAKVKEAELGKAEEEYKEATEELMRWSLVKTTEDASPKCPRCGKTLSCPLCNPTGSPGD
jgi:DNA repair exonuclease SbcCD ATPase subunit